jgi:hypothetical protein
MADINQFAVIPEGSSSQVTTQRHQITALITEDGQTIADFTGGSALSFPEVLDTIESDKRLELITDIASRIVRIKAGLE